MDQLLVITVFLNSRATLLLHNNIWTNRYCSAIHNLRTIIAYYLLGFTKPEVNMRGIW